MGFTFSSCRKNLSDLTPKDLVQDDAVARYRVFLTKSDSSTYRRVWGMCEQQLRGLIGPRKRFTDPEQALLNLDMSFPSWFRVLYPWPVSEPLYQEFGDSARDELMAEPQLRRHLVEVCPCQYQEFQQRYGQFPESFEAIQPGGVV